MMMMMRSMSSASSPCHLSTCGCNRYCCFGTEFGEQMRRRRKKEQHQQQLCLKFQKLSLKSHAVLFSSFVHTLLPYVERQQQQQQQRVPWLKGKQECGLISCEASLAKDALSGSSSSSSSSPPPLHVSWVCSPPPVHNNHGSHGPERPQEATTSSTTSSSTSSTSSTTATTTAQGRKSAIGKEQLQIVGVGKKIPALFHFCSQSPLLSSAEFRVISTDSNVLQSFQTFQQPGGGARQADGSLLDPEKMAPVEALKLNGPLFLAVAGSTEALDTATNLLQAAQDQRCLAVSIVVLPFHFEGQRRRKEAEEAMHILGASSDILIVVEQDALMRKEMVTVAEADCLACTAVLLGIKALSDLLLGDNQVMLDATSCGQQDIDSFEIKTILQQGGKACLGFGKGGSVKAAMGSAALDSPFMHGWLAEEEKGAVLCTVTSAAKINPKEVQEALRLLQGLVGKQQLICTSVQEPSLDPGVFTATIIITRLNSIGLQQHMISKAQPNASVPKSTATDGTGTGNNDARSCTPDGVDLAAAETMLKHSEHSEAQSGGAHSKRSDPLGASDGKSIPATSSVITRTLNLRFEGGVVVGPSSPSKSVGGSERQSTATGNAWKAGPSSAAAEAWALSRSQAREQSVAVDPEEGASIITIGIRPRVEQQRAVSPHPYRKPTTLEVIPVDPAAVPRKGVGAMLDRYRALLQGRDSSPALAPTTLSQRAASMLENERSTNKLTQVMEIELNQGLYKGRCQAGLPEGKGRLTYADGSFYEGQWKQGNRHGTGAFYYANGDMYQGSWKNNVMHGQGWLYFHTGDRLHAHYVNGVANGEARYYSADGNVFFGRLRDNWRHGECLYIEASGSRWREVWDYGMFVLRTPIQDSSGSSGSWS